MRPIRAVLRRALRATVLAAFGSTLVAAAPPPASAEPPPGPAGWLYDADRVVRVDLGLQPASLAALAAEPDEYQPGTFAVEADGVVHGPLEVGIRLKGGMGSFRGLDGKAAFKVKVDEYVEGQTFFGLEKLTLNNMVQDASMVHEALAYELFRSLGVPASRTGYAFVRVNGEGYGLYLNIETLDSVSLPRWFDTTRHLYEGSYENDVRTGAAGEFEVDEGDSGERADLEALIAAVNSEAGEWSEGMAAVADLEEMTLSWAVERYLGHWDGYAGILVGKQPNNYFLHSDNSGLFRMLPWGTDQTWERRLDFGGEAGIMLNRCLEDESCAAAYAEALRRVRAEIAALGLGGRAAALASTLRPWLALDPRGEHTQADFETAVARTRLFMHHRAADLADWLGEKPPAVGDAKPPQAEPASGKLPAVRALRPWFAVLSLRAFDSAAHTRLRLPGAGTVMQRGTAQIDGRSRAVCLARARVARRGEVTLRCRLAPVALQHLRRAQLRVSLGTCFASPAGAASCSIDTVAFRPSARGRSRR